MTEQIQLRFADGERLGGCRLGLNSTIAAETVAQALRRAAARGR